MNSSSNFTEWSREEKEEFARKRMDEMKLKNEKLLQRHAEVENDRLKAESQNSAVTAAVAKTTKKEKNLSTVEGTKEESRTEHAREWDRGKPDKDQWRSPEHRGSSFKNYRSSGRFDRKDDRKDNWGSFSRNDNTDRSRHNRGNEDSYEKRKDTWSGYSRNDSNDHYRYHTSSDDRKVRGSYRYKQNDNSQHVTSRLQMSPKRTRGVGYRNNDSQRKSQSSYSDDKYKRSDYNRSNSRKKHSYRAHSRSTSRSGSDHAERFTIRAYNLWQNDKISEDQTKQNRVERWVKSVNKTNNMWARQFSPEQEKNIPEQEKNIPEQEKNIPEQKDKTTSRVSLDQKDKNTDKASYSKFDRFEHSRTKSSDEEEYDTNINASRGKSCENSKYSSQQYSENKNEHKGASYSLGSKIMEGLKKKGVQTKRSPQYSSGGSSKNGNFRKQRRFDSKGQKNDDDKNRFKPKNTFSASNTWKNQPLDKNISSGRYSKEDNTDTLNYNNDGWGDADQSDIRWEVSDHEIKDESKKQAKEAIDLTEADHKKGRLKDHCHGKEKKEKKQGQYDNDAGMWGDVDQSGVQWKSDAENQNLEFSNSKNCAIDSTAQEAAKTSPGDGWQHRHHSSGRSSDGKPKWTDESSSGQMTIDSGAIEGNITECHSSTPTRPQQHSENLSQKSHSEAEMIISSFKHSVCISDEKYTNVPIDHFSEKQVTSDDGGWSTLSEEGEVRSNNGKMSKNRKLYKRKHCD